jgi:hypothetical protein
MGFSESNSFALKRQFRLKAANNSMKENVNYVCPFQALIQERPTRTQSTLRYAIRELQALDGGVNRWDRNAVLPTVHKRLKWFRIPEIVLPTDVNPPGLTNVPIGGTGSTIFRTVIDQPPPPQKKTLIKNPEATISVSTPLN